MKTRLLLAATVGAGLVFAPAVLAQDAAKPVISKHKTHKAAKAHKQTDKAPRSPGKMKRNDDAMGEPYSTQKDEMMTR